MRRRLRLAGLLLGMTILTLSCSLISTSDLTGGIGNECDGGACNGSKSATDAAESSGDACAANTASDSANCGACGHVCGAGTYCAASMCVVGCAGGTLYVSGSNGSDAYDGCSTAKPKKTVGAALALVHKTRTAAKEIHVCRGTYTEASFALDVPVSLRGGYDCVAWERTATFGYPTFDGLNTTTLQTTPTGNDGITLEVTNPAVTSSVQLDGFTIVGPTTVAGGVTSQALALSTESSVSVHDNQIEGAPQSATATRGLNADLGATSEVFHNRITGGGGDVGSAGIVVGVSAALHVHDNAIDGGSSSGGPTYGFLAVFNAAPMLGASAFTGNTVQAGNGLGIFGVAGSIGVFGQVPVDVVGNLVVGGKSTCDASVDGCTSIGVTVTGVKGAIATSSAVIAGNRIVAGSATGDTAINLGVFAINLGAVTVVNNAVVAVEANPTLTQAVRISGIAAAIVESNTLFGSASALGVDPTAGAVVRNNLFLGDPKSSEYGAFRDEGCPRMQSPALVAFDHNGFVGFNETLASLYKASGSDCDDAPLTSFTSIAAAEPAATSNVRIAATCAAGDAPTCLVRSACTTTADDAACLTTVLASWDDASSGVSTLLDATEGLKLTQNAPCGIAQGGAPLVDPAPLDGGSAMPSALPQVASVLFDIAGKPRTAPFSIGAYEDDETCQ